MVTVEVIYLFFLEKGKHNNILALTLDDKLCHLWTGTPWWNNNTDPWKAVYSVEIVIFFKKKKKKEYIGMHHFLLYLPSFH